MLGHIARRFGHQMSNGLKGMNLPHVLTKETHRHLQSPFQTICPVSMMSLWPFSGKPQDFSQPNSSWSPEMVRLYEHYNALCDAENENGEKKRGPWRKLPSYDRTIKYATGGIHLSKLVQAKARLFTRCIEEEGAAFEYVTFLNKVEKTCVCVFQAGHLLEGAPGHLHGGAIATMIDTVTGTLAGYLSGPVMTAYLNTNYRSPVPLGSVLLIHCALDRIEGKKIFVNCKVTSSDESKLHTEAAALFVSINIGPLFGTRS
ncbi:acyl-coenzyme A thioesterase THEM4 [Triplophysa dalaica]|uniref:acyl-coenzyme A thioesterase THEM4 n=1 Tax=Triplophysa dalaica TaxID=1582913 RepID=UPI0024DF7013|nr:acyl-coenzyme A thioesterase THEM4 [Triplophysa dalaica]XP_056619176.1 acyl-coenzyme A thioesterase THEM4 [Triplophysa dalaica]XP_056619177.1 acyl-coenzyme A thioesterase THEM4 [Triplophysa dalaica]